MPALASPALLKKLKQKHKKKQHKTTTERSEPQMTYPNLRPTGAHLMRYLALPCFPGKHEGMLPFQQHGGTRLSDSLRITNGYGANDGVVSLLSSLRISSSRTNISSKQHLSSSRRPRRSNRSSSSRTAPKPMGRPGARVRAEGARVQDSSTARTPASTRCLQTRNHA